MTDERDVRDAAWILIHHVDDYRASNLDGLLSKAQLFVDVCARFTSVTSAGPPDQHGEEHDEAPQGDDPV